MADIAHLLFFSLLSIYIYLSNLSVYILVFTFKIHIYFRVFSYTKINTYICKKCCFSMIKHKSSFSLHCSRMLCKNLLSFVVGATPGRAKRNRPVRDRHV